MIIPIMSADHSNCLPTTAGIYAIRNKVTNSVYIGLATNLRRRYGNWHADMNRSRSITRYMREEIRHHPDKVWVFAVLADGNGLTRDQLFELERKAIRAALDKGLRLLNIGPMRRLRELELRRARQKVSPSRADPLELYMGFDEEFTKLP